MRLAPLRRLRRGRRRFALTLDIAEQLGHEIDEQLHAWDAADARRVQEIEARYSDSGRVPGDRSSPEVKSSEIVEGRLISTRGSRRLAAARLLSEHVATIYPLWQSGREYLH
jgi:hypothetical protein